MSYETVAEKVNTLYINGEFFILKKIIGHDTYSENKAHLYKDLRLIEIFNAGNPSYQFTEYLEKFNSIMYTDVCNNYIKAYNINNGGSVYFCVYKKQFVHWICIVLV